LFLIDSTRHTDDMLVKWKDINGDNKLLSKKEISQILNSKPNKKMLNKLRDTTLITYTNHWEEISEKLKIPTYAFWNIDPKDKFINKETKIYEKTLKKVNNNYKSKTYKDKTHFLTETVGDDIIKVISKQIM